MRGPEIRILQACAKNDLNEVRRCLKKGLFRKPIDINVKDSKGETPLLLASLHDGMELASFLVSEGADITAKNERAETPLSRAVLLRSLEMTEFFIEKGAAIDEEDIDGRTPLILALETGELSIGRLSYSLPKVDEEIAGLLISNGADINHRDSFGHFPLLLAVEAGKQKLLKLLIEGKVDMSPHPGDSDSPLISAIRENQVGIARTLIKHGAPSGLSDPRGETALGYAVREGKLEFVELLLPKGAAPDRPSGDQSFIVLAIENDQYAIAKLLIEKGMPVNEAGLDGYTPLQWACCKTDAELVLTLLNHRSDPNQNTHGMKGTALQLLLKNKSFNRDARVQLFGALMEAGARASLYDLWVAENLNYMEIAESLEKAIPPDLPEAFILEKDPSIQREIARKIANPLWLKELFIAWAARRSSLDDDTVYSIIIEKVEDDAVLAELLCDEKKFHDSDTFFSKFDTKIFIKLGSEKIKKLGLADFFRNFFLSRAEYGEGEIFKSQLALMVALGFKVRFARCSRCHGSGGEEAWGNSYETPGFISCGCKPTYRILPSDEPCPVGYEFFDETVHG